MMMVHQSVSIVRQCRQHHFGFLLRSIVIILVVALSSQTTTSAFTAPNTSTSRTRRRLVVREEGGYKYVHLVMLQMDGRGFCFHGKE